MDKIQVGVLGATGMVGQNYVRLLENHPWFEVRYVAASERSAGKGYEEAVAGRWHAEGYGRIPTDVGSLAVHTIEEVEEAKKSCSFVFSAVGSEVAREWEEKYAAAGMPVVSNASAHRHTKDVPVLIPEINHGHTDIIPAQRKNRNWKGGFIAVKPNCSLQSYLTPLFALREFGVKQAVVSTMQAVSGAGFPSVQSMDMADNVVPFIKDEEEKSEREPLKILGSIAGSEIAYAAEPVISAHCSRVPVVHGHMAAVSVAFRETPQPEQVLEGWKNFRSLPQELKLPSAPKHPILYHDEPDRPQTRLDRDAESGMAVSVGRLRPCNVLDYRFVGLSHNIIRGAAGGGILNAELLKAKGYLDE